MKKLLSLMLCLALIFSIAPLGAIEFKADAAELNGNITYSIAGETVTIDAVNPATEDVVTIPATIEDLPVTKIANYAFSDCSKITEVVLPASVTTIGNKIFDNCNKLKSITLPFPIEMSTIFPDSWGTAIVPESLKTVKILGGKTVPEKCFADCGYITTIELPETIETIEYHAFGGCGSLKNFSVPASVETIGDRAFANCPSLKELHLSANVTEVGDAILDDCDSIESITLPYPIASATIFPGFWGTANVPESLETITVLSGEMLPEKCFDGCSSVTTINLPETIIEIGYCAFRDCTALQSIIIPENTESIGKEAFVNCAALTELTIPASVEEIGDAAFAECKGLTSMTIPLTVKTIGEHVLKNCDAITEVTLPFLGKNATDNTDATIGYTFRQNYGTMIVPDSLKKVTVLGGKAVSNNAFRDCVNISSITLPATITTIGNYAFAGCTALPYLTIPAAVTEIGSYAFAGCTMLKSVSIPNAVSVIKNETFENCTALASVTFPSALVTIERYAFENCMSLKALAFPAKLETISEYAFRGCKNLTSIKLSNKVKTIGYEAFSGCEKLASLDIGYGVVDFNRYAFSGCNSIKTAVFHSASSRDSFKTYLPNYEKIVFSLHTYKLTKAAGIKKNGSLTKTCACNVASTKKVYGVDTIRLNTTSYSYTGGQKKPSATVKDVNGKKLTYGVDYTLSYGVGRRNVGKYSVTVKFIGNFTGSKTLYFNIYPKNVKIKSLKAGSKKFTLKWGKLAEQATGYEIQYSTSSSFSKKTTKTVKVKSYKTVSKTISKLKAKKKYYVRIRSYKKVGKTTYYSLKWTKKTVTTKK